MNRIKLIVGALCQRAAWRLCDPHDAWAIDYTIDGKRYGEIVHGRYRMAIAKAKELHGRVLGSHAKEIVE